MTPPDERVSLRDHIDKQFELRDRATDLAGEDLDRRLDQMNELREQISQERGHFVTVELYEQRYGEMEKRFTDLGDRVAITEGKAIGMSTIFGWILAGLSVLIALAALLIVAL